MIDNEFPWLLGHQGIVLRKKIPDIHFVKVVAFKPGSRKSEGGLNCNGPQDGKKIISYRPPAQIYDES